MSKLQENVRLLEGTRAATLRMVGGLTQEQMDWAPGPEQWSVGENLDHLLRSEAIYRREITELAALARQGKTAFIRRSVHDIDFSPSFLPKSMLPAVDLPFTVVTMFVPPVVRDLMIRYSSVLKGQTPKAAIPAKGRPAAELVEAMRRSWEQTRDLLAANPGFAWDRMRVQHPLLGINSVPQLVRLTALHETRHQDQIGRVLAAMPLPATV